MNTFIFGSNFIQAQTAMIRLCMGLVLIGLTVETHAAQFGTGLFATGLDLLTIRLSSYDNARDRLGIIGSSHLPGHTKQEKENFWVTSIRWHLAPDGEHASFSPHLRIESKETMLVIKPIQHSVWMVWRRALD